MGQSPSPVAGGSPGERLVLRAEGHGPGADSLAHSCSNERPSGRGTTAVVAKLVGHDIPFDTAKSITRNHIFTTNCTRNAVFCI